MYPLKHFRISTDKWCLSFAQYTVAFLVNIPVYTS